MKQEIIPISLAGVKSYLIKGDKWILVDTGFSFSYKKLVKNLNKYNIKPEDMSLIILTHNHLDHVGGLLKIYDLTHSKVLIHENDGNDLRDGVSSVVKPVTLLSKFIFKFIQSKHIHFTPQIEINEEMDLEPYGVKGKVIHTPGHTPGSISILLESGEVIVGDLITAKKKKAKLFYVVDNLEDLKDSLKKLIQLGANKFYTSHGKTCSDKEVLKIL